MNNNTTKTIAQINNSDILVIDDSGKWVPVKQICMALGIAYQPQVKKIKEDLILGTVTALRVATGQNGKSYEMFCIPFKYAFGWLFTINPKNVKEEDKVIEYKMACYDALYTHFTDKSGFLEPKQKAINEIYLNKLEEFNDIGSRFAHYIKNET